MKKSEEQKIWDKFLSQKRLMSLLDNEKEKGSKESTDTRNSFERDCDRIIYSYPFRRLQDKTQVIPFPHFDFVHTRLTHSLEVSTVGRSLGKMLENFLLKKRKLNIGCGEIPAIVNAACLAHDIGNPPFGHSGEDSISEYFKYGNGGEHILNIHFKKPDIDKKNIAHSYGFTSETDVKKVFDIENFEGNAMGFKILSSLTKGGMNLTCATLAAFAKYPRESYVGTENEVKFYKEKRVSQKKYGFFFSERETFKKIAEEVGLISLSSNSKDHYTWARHPLAFLMEAADDICYRIIDFEDGCRLKKISYTCTNKCTVDDCPVEKTGEDIIKAIAKKNVRYDEATYKELLDNTTKISYLRALSIGVLVKECFQVFEKNYQDILSGKFDQSLIDAISADLILSLKEMKGLVNNGVYQSREVLETEATGFEVVGGLIEAFVNVTEMCLSNCPPDSQPKKFAKIFKLIPDEYKPLSSDDKYTQLLKIIDYISGMTDGYAINLYRKIKGIQLPH